MCRPATWIRTNHAIEHENQTTNVAVDPPRQPDRPCAKRREGTVPIRRFLVPRGETTGRDRPYSSFRPIDGGAAAQGQMRGRPIKQKGRRDRAYRQKTGRPARCCGDARSRRGRAARQNKKGPPRVSSGRASAHARENAPCWPAASCSPTDYTAVPSALGGLTSGFGTGPGVPPLPWPPANKGRSHPPAQPVRALRAAQRSKAPPGPGPRPHALPASAGGGIE